MSQQGSRNCSLLIAFKTNEAQGSNKAYTYKQTNFSLHHLFYIFMWNSLFNKQNGFKTIVLKVITDDKIKKLVLHGWLSYFVISLLSQKHLYLF